MVLIETPLVAEHYIGKVKISKTTVVRLLVLKHAYRDDRKLSNNESRDVIQAANFAASRGLTISDIGNHHVNRDGHIRGRVVWGKKYDLNNLKSFISKQMKVDAVRGDTLVIYTTGHGGEDGTLVSLGLRKDIMKIFAEAAEENDQEILWWQSSCYAAAELPPISSLNNKQQRLLSMIASSSADRPSYWGDQTEPMRKVFVAMAEKSRDIDPNQDQEITAKELADFMNNKVRQNSGDLLFSRGPDEPIFGLFGPWSLPIVDKNSVPDEYGRNYIPIPWKI